MIFKNFHHLIFIEFMVCSVFLWLTANLLSWNYGNFVFMVSAIPFCLSIIIIQYFLLEVFFCSLSLIIEQFIGHSQTLMISHKDFHNLLQYVRSEDLKFNVLGGIQFRMTLFCKVGFLWIKIDNYFSKLSEITRKKTFLY